MWKNWLTYSKGERNGLIILLFLICVAALLPSVYRVFSRHESRLANPADFYRIDSFFTALQYEPRVAKEKFNFSEAEKPVPLQPELFPFNPNTISVADLVKLGFSVRQAAVIESYRSKGGVFKSSTDFAKMYVVDEKMFQRLEPYIEIPASEPVAPIRETENERIADLIVIELNSTDTIELIKLRGIGRVYARRIVDYRQMLGGYTHVEQLKEIYKFPEGLLESLKPQLWVDTTKVRKMNLNLISYQELREHPYITEYQARAIVYYREKAGNIHSVDELQKHKLLDAYSFNRLKGYFAVN